MSATPSEFDLPEDRPEFDPPDDGEVDQDPALDLDEEYLDDEGGVE